MRDCNVKVVRKPIVGADRKYHLECDGSDDGTIIV